MEQDPFGNLKDWGAVIDLLERLEKKGMLGDCQKGIIRILRYKDNWRLREETLKRLSAIENPLHDLIEQLIALVEDENLYYQARIMALLALQRLAKDRPWISGTDTPPDEPRWRTALQQLLETHQPPIFANALIDCLNCLECQTMAEGITPS